LHVIVALHSTLAHPLSYILFFFNATPPPEIYPLSLHDALPISGPAHTVIYSCAVSNSRGSGCFGSGHWSRWHATPDSHATSTSGDRKSTRLNSSHVSISYAVFCLKKKKKINQMIDLTQIIDH